MFVLSASAETVSGTEGSITWSYNTETKILTVSGTGAIKDYNNGSSTTPWGEKTIEVKTTKYQWVEIPGIVEPGRYVEMTVADNVAIIDHLTKVVIGEGITTIGISAFQSAKELTTIQLPSTITNIKSMAFQGCSKLSSATWNNIAENATISNTSFSATQLVKDNALYFGTNLITVYTTKSGAFDIKTGTTKIHANAISGCTGITSVTIPSSVTTIGDNAFEGCTSLNTITFNNATNITSWGSNIFKNCKTVTTNGYKVAGGCVITDVTDLTKKKYTLPAGIVYIAENAFAGCNNAQYLDLSDYTKAPTFASGALADVTNATTLVAAGYEKNFTAKGWKNVNTTKFSIYNNKFVSRTFLHDAITPTGVAVYRAEVTGSKVKLIKINADNAPCKVAAGEGVFLRASTNKEYTFSPAGQSVAMMSNNAIKGVTEDMTFDGSENAYILATVDGIQDFYRIADTYTLSMGKAYLDGGSSDLSKLNAFEEETSGIDQVETQQSNAKTTIYNMNGQRLSAPQEGINIINGKKYIVK